ncbi:Glycerophosphoryl diester phosphodiesterase [hydrothermal vent metagenome]|uniref:Glycerophosphoryl diester phosphodiesterase n=1 Tax=hydrothermal vent metagenome TaxID=652676 RepID=A0A3B0XVL2_9ZZZZ
MKIKMKKTSSISLLVLIFGVVSCGSSSEPPASSIPENSLSVTTPASAKSDDFSVDGVLTDFVTNNENSLPDVTKTGGRYRANLIDNTDNITLHFNGYQGRLDAKRVSFPFEFIARNIGIGTQADSQQAKSSSGNSFIFAGVQVHVIDLDSRNSSHIVVGHRGTTSFTLEGKNTVGDASGAGVSTVDDMGANVVPSGRADLRVVGNVDRSLTIYWQPPEQAEDNWRLYEGFDNGNGQLPGVAPNYGAEVYVGLITYAQDANDIPFVGTCDAIEIYEK